jgi:uncharacterized protein YutE (UPF0331/DUF86 family)
VVRREVVAAKVGRARARLNDAALPLPGPEETYLADPQRRDLALFYLFLTIQKCIDLSAHWVADAGWSEPDDAASRFCERGVIDRSWRPHERLRKRAGLRVATPCSITHAFI